MSGTATDEIDAAFTAALKQDAGVQDPGEPDFPPPPARPAAKAEDARPRTRKPRAPKPSPDSRPRTSAAGDADGRDYTGDLLSLGMNVWGAASMVRGFGLGRRKTPGGTVPLVKVPDLRPYAAVLNQSLPNLAAAWNQAARQDPRVRAWVEKFTSGDAPTWILGVAVATGQFAAGCYAMATAPAEARAEAAEANDAALQAAIEAQVKAMGMAA